MGGCVGGFAKSSTPKTSKSRNNTGFRRGAYGHSTPQKEWWSSSEMETNHSRSSQKSTSSVSGQENRGNESSSFVNPALDLWNERRREWVGAHLPRCPRQKRESVISRSATYEDLLTTSRPFVQPVPLAEMVDFLMYIWEEGQYD
ncbi:hypothetical protein O6H91_07G042500 [Diphasiastrum complanatum]|uniref:Uncharacterized protein n=1 Tax=Diphasiastrum complanatum TaxID=34168 RepID=A0ACC2D4H1_DIPCM|nr:hypothetical protein O6H91_07G042500 [Diphasiastrum complanatum]